MQTIYEFATPIAVSEIDKHSDLKEFIKSLVPTNNQTSISFTSEDNLHHYSEFKFFVEQVMSNTQKYAEEVLGVKIDDLELSGMWANLQNNGSSHPMHQHPNSFISGVFYLQIPDKSENGKIIFDDPRISKNMQHANFFKESCISNRSIWVEPKEGVLILFPSWLVHGTQPFLTESQDKRISISFNFRLKNCEFRTMKIKKEDNV